MVGCADLTLLLWRQLGDRRDLRDVERYLGGRANRGGRLRVVDHAIAEVAHRLRIGCVLRSATLATAAAARRELVEEPEQLYRDRHDKSAVALARNLNDGLQEPQLERGGIAGHHVGRGC